MITFKQFLTEIFDGSNIYKWKQERMTRSTQEYSFDMEKGNFTLVITSKDNPDKTIYVIDFGFVSTLFYRHHVKVTPLNKFDLKTTLKIYNTVIDIIRVKIKPHLKSGDIIRFVAVSERTFKIYDRFARMIAKEIDGEYRSTNHGEFRIVKK